MFLNIQKPTVLVVSFITSDTEPLYTEIFQKVIDPYGKQYTWEVKQKLMGRQSEETARIMVSEYDLPMTWEEFAEKAKVMGQLIMATATLLPGKYHYD